MAAPESSASPRPASRLTLLEGQRREAEQVTHHAQGHSLGDVPDKAHCLSFGPCCAGRGIKAAWHCHCQSSDGAFDPLHMHAYAVY
jgi:hypothetical protein